MNSADLAIVEALDDGTLYATPSLIQEMFTYPYLEDAFLLVSYDCLGNPTGYIPVGINDDSKFMSYIPAIPPSAPVCPTYTPGAINVLRSLAELVSGDYIYFDVDVVANTELSAQEETASAICLSLEKYLHHLSSSRRKDIRRKLKQSSQLSIEAGGLDDVLAAWPWMKGVWQRRNQYDIDHVNRVLSWLSVIEQSGRGRLKIDKYMFNGKMVGINCCVLHYFHGTLHCDDYLTWFDAKHASGLGIVSAVNNLSNPAYQGARYNLGLPGFYGKTFDGHEYKWDVIPKSLRLTQSIVNIKLGNNGGKVSFDCI
jgi:hypothetical protein